MDNQTTRPVVLRKTGAAAADSLARVVALLATGLERWLAKQSNQDGAVDFVADSSVTTSHHDDDDVIEDLQWR